MPVKPRQISLLTILILTLLIALLMPSIIASVNEIQAAHQARCGTGLLDQYFFLLSLPPQLWVVYGGMEWLINK